MKRSSSVQILAAAASSTSSEAATMSSRPPYRGGRNQWRRRFSDRTAGDGGRGHVVTGDSHFDSVRDANLGFRPNETPNFPNQSLFRPNFNPRPSLNPMPSPPFHQNQRFPPPHLHQNQRFRPPQQIHVRPQKPLDYRNWELAKPEPLPHCERFTVLSYNILADYLAINHRSRLYFHIPRHMLEWEWRKRNIIHELGLWSSDILCFQEVDRFHDLEEELKRRGYNGFWKMRTGDPVDGCAIFWRVSRFKLLHEECIEFNKLGLRDNVAQICVLESLHKNDNKRVSALPLSLTGSNKVVICNIHVLYNPRRGEIKLGQIRVLLDRAHAVSKLWDDAPVVLCGDFNCTPKSPLYNYISEQKLNLSDLPRDKLSGQTSAEIHPPRYFSLNFRAQAVDSTGGGSAGIDNRELKQSGSLFDVQEQNNSESNSVNLPMNNLSQAKCGNTKLNEYDNHSVGGQCGNKNDTSSNEMTRETHQDVDDCRDKNHSFLPAPDGSLKESPSSSRNKGTFFSVDSRREDVYSNLIEIGLPKKIHQDSVDCQKDEFHSTVSVSGLKESATSPQNGGVSGAQRKDEFEFTPVDSCHEDIHSYLKETEHGDKLHAAIDAQHNSSSEQSQPNLQTENELMSCDKSKLPFLGDNNSTDGIIDPTPLGASNSYISSSEPFHETSFPSTLKDSTMGSSENLSFDDDKDIPSILSKDNISCELTSIDFMIDEKVENSLLKEVVENDDGESFSEGSAEFLSELHGEHGSFSSNFNFSERFAAVPHGQQLHHPKNEMDNDSPGMNSVSVDALNFTYNPSAWTPMEIETATGNADCTHVEHPLRLRSTYAEVEDHSGTRDSNGEPLVTSYNRCFSGTVDYIWRSEGLQTVRVLAPMPKLAMQWTPGFPTKKWGSDHIALVTELAFIKDASVRNTEAP